MFNLSKRKRFIITSTLLSAGFVGIQLLPENYRFISIGVLGVLTFLLFAWSLKEGIEFNATLATLILPVFFTVSVGLFWFLLPTNILTRIPVIVLFGIGIYSLCLTANIYTVAAIRTIALFRAARGVGFVLTILTFFLIFDTILSMRWPLYLYLFSIFLVSMTLFLQGFWSVILEKKFKVKELQTSWISSLVLTEIALALFFWPTSVAVGSLLLTVSAYVILGLGQADLEGRFFTQTIREYLLVGIIVFLGVFLTMSWG